MSSSTGHVLWSPMAQPLRRRALLCYVAALAFPVATVVLRLAFWEQVPGLPFVFFIPTVALCSVMGGVGPASLAALVSAILGLAYLAVPSPLGQGSQAIWAGLASYAVVCLILVASARQSAQAAARAVAAAETDAAARESVLRAKLELAQLTVARGAAERRLEQVTDALPVFISQVGRDRRFQFVNRAYEEWFGRRREDLIGRSVEEVIGPEASAQARPHLDRVLSGERTSFEAQVPHVSGELRHVRATYVPNIGEDGTVEGYFGFVQDITEAKQQANLLSQRERHLRAVMDSVTDCFYAVDGEWRITLFNRAAEQYYGIGRDAVLGRKLWEAFPAHAGSVFDLQLKRVMEDRVPVTFEARSVVFPDRFIEMRVSPKEGSGLAVAFSDISSRKAQERQRELLINELNHRVKNTLAVVQSIATQSLRDTRVPQDTRAAFEGRLMALAAAHDLLTRESWETAQLGTVVRAALQPFDSEHRFEVSGPDLRLRPQAAVSLTLALHELATNATKYGALSNKSGTVAVTWTVSTDEMPMFHLTWAEQGGPPVTPPTRSGFGSRLIQKGLAGELGGPVTVEFLPDGVVCRIEAPLANLQAG
ncbi:PAS domain S-box protein [Rubellimicrobium rubrum]|uniref:histidine kinase n=1 Tax=Rubellimicrobium rubrum TaxID=2585369 RepID=A0A5C4MW35_9RHOB|nr:PAS domain-containing protein [Rubellimicrobium rubrum]TNC48591.1 PAS domain S-box protein [Rubellimicrobium rubrum]